MRRHESLHIRLLFFALLASALACGEESASPGGSGTRDDDAGLPDADGTHATDGGPADSGSIPSSAGEVAIGTVSIPSSGESDVIEFELPEGTRTFTVVVAGDDDTTFIPSRVEGPTGVLVDDAPVQLDLIEQLVIGAFPSQFKSRNRVVSDNGVVAAMFPNNPNVEVEGGLYRMKLRAVRVDGQGVTPASGDVDVTIHYKADAPDDGRIDVMIHLSGAGAIYARDAASHALLSEAIGKLRATYAEAGIEIGDVAYADIDTRFQRIRTLDGPGNDLAAMFALSAGTRGGLHYFLVDTIEGPIPGAIGGISGGVPGPPRSPGSINTGVAVALRVAASATDLAHVMAHEGGHWLGLFHTVEAFGGMEDQLPDTPNDRADTTNLMYPTVGGSETITPSQARVLRQHIEVANR